MSKQQKGSVTQYRGEDYCRRCNGEGEINDWVPCASCLGTGRTFHEHVFNLTDVCERTVCRCGAIAQDGAR